MTMELIPVTTTPAFLTTVSLDQFCGNPQCYLIRPESDFQWNRIRCDIDSCEQCLELAVCKLLPVVAIYKFSHCDGEPQVALRGIDPLVAIHHNYAEPINDCT